MRPPGRFCAATAVTAQFALLSGWQNCKWSRSGRAFAHFCSPDVTGAPGTGIETCSDRPEPTDRAGRAPSTR